MKKQETVEIAVVNWEQVAGGIFAIVLGLVMALQTEGVSSLGWPYTISSVVLALLSALAIIGGIILVISSKRKYEVVGKEVKEEEYLCF